MRKRLMALCLSGVLAAGTLTACSLPFGDKEEEQEEEVEIEVSTGKVKLDVGEEDEIEIENYDDLKKLDFEVEDEDIAVVEEDDDGVYIVTGISEGKTTVTFSAKDCEDVTVKITVYGISEPVTLGVFELSDYSMTVDYSDPDTYLYINNWAEIEDDVKSTLTIRSDNINLLSVSSYPTWDGGIWLASLAQNDDYATVTISADGFETAYCTVYCTHQYANGPLTPRGELPEWGVVDYNNDETVNIWSYSMSAILDTLAAPSGYHLDTEAGGLNVDDKTYYAYFVSDEDDDMYITVVGEMPYEEWMYIRSGTEPEGFTMDNIREIGEYNGQTIYAVDETLDGNDFVLVYYEYYNTENMYLDYIGIALPVVLIDGYTDEDIFDMFLEMHIMG